MRDCKVNEFDMVDRALKHNTAYSIHQSKECLRLPNMMRYNLWCHMCYGEAMTGIIVISS